MQWQHAGCLEAEVASGEGHGSEKESSRET
jgi:hypothetical protein